MRSLSLSKGIKKRKYLAHLPLSLELKLRGDNGKLNGESVRFPPLRQGQGPFNRASVTKKNPYNFVARALIF